MLKNQSNEKNTEKSAGSGGLICKSIGSPGMATDFGSSPENTVITVKQRICLNALELFNRMFLFKSPYN